MEIKANEAFDVYRDLYYEGGVSSVYFWNLDDGFAGVVLLKKCTSLPCWAPAMKTLREKALTLQQPRHLVAVPRVSGTRSTSSRPSSVAAPHSTSLPRP